MAINKINNGDSGSVVRGIINAVIDAVNGFSSTALSLTQRVEYLEYKQNERVVVSVFGKQDGSNRKYTTGVSYILGTSALYLNGARLFPNIDYKELDKNSFEFLTYIPKSGDIIIFEVLKEK